MINIATISVIITLSIKTFLDVKEGYLTENSLSYIVMFSVMSLFFASVYSVTGMFIKNLDKSSITL